MMNAGVYPDTDQLYADVCAAYNKAAHAFYDAGCRYLQLDDISFAYLCDHDQREMLREALKDKPYDLTITMHLCRGNSRSTFIASDGFEPLRCLPKGKTVVVGLVTSKKGTLESKDDIKRRIDEATNYVDLDQLCLSPQCGCASMEEGSILAEEEQWAKLRMIVEIAIEVWGRSEARAAFFR